MKIVSEIRWLRIGAADFILEVKYAVPTVDASGAFCGWNVDEEWSRIPGPTIKDSASY